MSKKTGEQDKREHDFRLQRKYLLVTNFIALLYLVGDATIRDYSLLGTKISFKNDGVFPTFLSILFVYSLFRYSQYYVTIYHSHFLADLRSDSHSYFYQKIMLRSCLNFGLYVENDSFFA